MAIAFYCHSFPFWDFHSRTLLRHVRIYYIMHEGNEYVHVRTDYNLVIEKKRMEVYRMEIE